MLILRKYSTSQRVAKIFDLTSRDITHLHVPTEHNLLLFSLTIEFSNIQTTYLLLKFCSFLQTPDLTVYVSSDRFSFDLEAVILGTFSGTRPITCQGRFSMSYIDQVGIEPTSFMLSNRRATITLNGLTSWVITHL